MAKHVVGRAVIAIDLLGMTVGALALYACLVWLANQYSRRTNWQVNHAGAEYNWDLRRNIAITLGGVAVTVGAVCGTLWISEWVARVFVIGQAALLAAAGASDIRRFHLPLPFTLAGIGIAVLGGILSHVPTTLFLFALIWAAVSIVLHTLASRGSIQLGDHIATVWIALAAPYNGLPAVMLGDFANIVLARVKGLRGKKVAAAGAWLVFTAALIGLPPYFAWFTSRPGVTVAPPALPTPLIQGMQSPLMATTTITHTLQITATLQATATLQMVEAEQALIFLAENASDNTASVALANEHAGRVIAAKKAAGNVALITELAARVAPDSAIVVTLGDLSHALDAFDVEGVREASARLEEERLQLGATLSAQKIITEDTSFTQ